MRLPELNHEVLGGLPVESKIAKKILEPADEGS